MSEPLKGLPANALPDGERALPAPRIHGILLIMGGWCTVFASGLLAPVLPQIRDHFAGTPHLDLMIGFVATMPSLAVALLSIPIGWVADRVGLTQVLLAGLAAYGISGVIPYWLNSLGAIVAARFAVGIGEAAVMITSTALLGLLFTGAARTQWFGIQVAAANFLGIGVLFGGGLLGLGGWHVPFLAYSFGLILLVPCLLLLPRPLPARNAPEHDVRAPAPAGMWLLVIESCALIFVSSMALYAVIVQAGFLLEARGASDSAQIGTGMAIAATGIAVGAASSGWLTRLSTAFKTRLAFLLMGSGLIAMMLADTVYATAFSGMIAGLGCGGVIPVLLSRLLGRIPAARIGSVTGLWVASTFLGQFATPPVFIWLKDVGGGEAAAMGLFGGFCLAAAAAIPLLMRSERVTAS